MFKFGNWDSDIHYEFPQVGALKRGLKLKDGNFNKEAQTMTYIGSSGDEYFVTLNSCTCVDFENRGLPCKHIYCLANELGYITEFSSRKGNSKHVREEMKNDMQKYKEYFKFGSIKSDAYEEVCRVLNKWSKR